jgi:hypothetical protein
VAGRAPWGAGWQHKDVEETGVELVDPWQATPRAGRGKGLALVPRGRRTARDGQGRGWSVFGLLDELGQVELLAEAADQLQLSLEVVDVLFLVAEDVLE